MKKPIIIMDNRERGEIRKQFSNLPCDIQLEQLEAGDYLIGPEFAIERKRGDDLASSICDNRFFSQLKRMLEYYPKSLIILESPKLAFQRSGLKESSIYGAMMYASYKMNIPIIPAQNERQTAMIIYSFAKHHQASLKKQYAYKPLKIKNYEISHTEQIDWLEGLVKVGRKKAEKLLNEFKTPMAIISELKNSEVEKTATGNIKGITGRFSELKGYGPTFVQSNKRLLELPFESTKNLPTNLLTKNF